MSLQLDTGENLEDEAESFSGRACEQLPVGEYVNKDHKPTC